MKSNRKEYRANNSQESLESDFSANGEENIDSDVSAELNNKCIHRNTVKTMSKVNLMPKETIEIKSNMKVRF